jgi:hypothetical protein
MPGFEAIRLPKPDRKLSGMYCRLKVYTQVAGLQRPLRLGGIRK